MGYFYGYCIEHLFFNLFNENVPFIATDKLKFCLSVFIISNSIFLLQNFYQCFDYCSKTLSYTIDRCPENYSPGKLPPLPVRVRVWFRISVRIRAGGLFSLGTIFLEPIDQFLNFMTLTHYFKFKLYNEL